MFVFTLDDIFTLIGLAIAGVALILWFIIVIINKIVHKFKGGKNGKARKSN